MVIRLFLDEHIDVRLAVYLEARGYDVLTTVGAGRAGQQISDEEQLAFAAESGRVILTRDYDDFPNLDAEWKTQQKEHAGILLCPPLSLGQMCSRVEAHLQRYTAEQHHNLLLWC